MNRKFVFKSIYTNLVIVATFVLIFEIWPLTVVPHGYFRVGYILMFVIWGYFEWSGFLSELVVSDQVNRTNPMMLSIAKFSQWVLVVGFMVVLFPALLIEEKIMWLAWIFVATYIQYLAIHLYYLIYRKKALQNHSHFTGREN